MLPPKLGIKLSGGVSFTWKADRLSDFAQQVSLSNRKNDNEVRPIFV
jgi:hypothetical protein